MKLTTLVLSTTVSCAPCSTRGTGPAGRSVGSLADRFEDFNAFAPLAIAAIGALPLPLMDRAIAINMRRSSQETERLDDGNPGFAASRADILKWAATCVLARDPKMPPVLRGRAADNWRPLIAVADSLGYGEASRAAAAKLCGERLDEDPGIVLLHDIRRVFRLLDKDRIASALLVEKLLEVDDGGWAEWRGPTDDRAPRKLTQSELAGLLRPFHIRSRTIWSGKRRAGDKSQRGYLRSQFDEAWRRYGPADDTPTQASKIKCLQ